MSWASANGVVNGNGTFAPDDNVTCEQMAVILYSYAKFKGIGTEDQGSLIRFPDAANVSGWATTVMRWAVLAGLFSGDGEGRLNPAGNVSCDEVAALLQRFCNVLPTCQEGLPAGRNVRKEETQRGDRLPSGVSLSGLL